MADQAQVLNALLANLAGIHDRMDTAKRPLGEIGSPHYQTIATDEVPCPHSGSRAGLPMNLTALRLTSRIWPQLLQLFSRHAGAARVYDAWRLTCALTTLPSLLHRAAVPPLAAAAFRTSQGLCQAFTAMALSEPGANERPLSSYGSGSDFYAWLDRDGWLVGDVQVCAAPPRMISEAFCSLACPSSAAVSAELDELIDTAAHAMTLTAMDHLNRLQQGPDGTRITSRHAFVSFILGKPDRQPASLWNLYPPTQRPDPPPIKFSTMHEHETGVSSAQAQRLLSELYDEKVAV